MLPTKRKDPRVLPPGEYTLGENLRLFVAPGGTRSWRVAYRLHGKRRQIVVGSLDDLDLDAAMRAAKDIQSLVAEGKDPVQHRRVQKIKAAASAGHTFRVAAEDWYRRYTPLRSRSWQLNCRRWLDRDVLPVLGNRAVADIEPFEILAVMESVERKVSASLANDVRGVISMVLDHAIARGAARYNVSTALRKAIPRPVPKSHPNLTEKQLQAFLRSDVATLSPSVRFVIQLLPHVVLRVAEITRLEVADVDVKAGLIRIPGNRMKMKREHLIPMSKHVRKIVEGALIFAEPGKYLFPGLTARDTHVSKSAINRAIERMELQFPIVPHSFRSTFSTMAREHDLGAHDAIELSLAHRLGGEIERSYNRAVLLQKRRELMQRWSDLLAQLARER